MDNMMMTLARRMQTRLAFGNTDTEIAVHFVEAEKADPRDVIYFTWPGGVGVGFCKCLDQPPTIGDGS